MNAAASPVTPGWLALRGPADARARTDGGSRLAAELAQFLRTRIRGQRPARLVDVGAGTGAGAAWLRERIPLAQEWRLLDHDPALLALAPPVAHGWARPVAADLEGLPALLAAEPADALTCQALLDLLDDRGIRAILEPAIASGAAVLCALTVTGKVRIAPRHRDDGLVGAAFNAHQRRAGRLGPDAASAAGTLLHAAGYAVTEAATPWRLDAAEPDLVATWLAGRAAAAADQAPADAGRIAAWLAERLALLRQGRLRAIVEHADILGVPRL